MIEQRQAILAGVSLGIKAINSNKYLDKMQDEAKQPLLGAQSGRVKNVIIVNDKGRIEDSLDSNQIPQVNSDGSYRYVTVKDISLPPLNSAGGPLSQDVPLPEGMLVVPENRAGAAGAFYFPIETEKGLHYVIVVLDSANTMSTVFRRQARQAFFSGARHPRH